MRILKTLKQWSTRSLMTMKRFVRSPIVDNNCFIRVENGNKKKG